MTARSQRRAAVCKDCGVVLRHADGTGSGRVRKTGPRCPACWRAERARRSEARHERDMAAEFGLAPGDYRRLYDAQGGRCALCGIARGLTKRLPVDHDHQAQCCGTEHPPDKGCRRCVRGLVCVACNDFLGYTRDDPQAFARGYHYLLDPPARRVLLPLLPE